MAVVNTKSNIITRLDSVPAKLPNAVIAHSRLREAVATVEVAAADDDTSTFRMVRLHSSYRVSAIEVFNDAITNGTSYDVGLYDTNENGGLVVSAGLFASAVDLSSAHAATGPLDVTYEATATNIDKIEKRLWELAGLTEDPNKDFDLVLTGNTVGTAAGTISVRVRFVAGD